MFEDRLRERLEPWLESTPEGGIIAASGGPDSTALLHLLHRMAPKRPWVVAHVHHGWRPHDSDLDRDHVRRQAQDLKLPFHGLDVDPPTSPHGLENDARRKRYVALINLAIRLDLGAIFLGHTEDDQVETVVMKILRGAGVSGLQGMPFSHRLWHVEPSLDLYRPLLDTTKETLLQWLHDNSIEYREDASNLDTRFLRNRLRLRDLPGLEEELGEELRPRVLEFAKLCRTMGDVCQKIVSRHECPRPHCWHGHAYDLEGLTSCAPAVAFCGVKLSAQGLGFVLRKDSIRLIHEWLHRPKTPIDIQLRKNISWRTEGPLILIGRSVVSPFQGSLEVPGRLTAPKWNHHLEARECESAESAAGALERAKRDRNRAIVDARSLEFPLTVSHREPGERVTMLGAPGRRKLKKIFSEGGVPRRLRNTWPVVRSGPHVVWIPGIGITDSFAIDDTTSKAVELAWVASKDP